MDKSVAVFPMDIHKRFSVATPMDWELEVMEKIRLEHGARERMQAQLGELPEGTDVVMEATFNWPWIADLVQQMGLTPHLAQPRETGRLRKGKPKTDGRDAMFLGKLWLGGVLPEAYLAPKGVRRMRGVSRWRMFLVRTRTATKNNIHGHLNRLGIDLSGRASDIFSPKGRDLLEKVTLPRHERELLEGKLSVVEILTALIEPIRAQMGRELAQDSRAPIIISIPGIAEVLAYTMLAEIGEIQRFANPRALASYTGVLPLERESADKQFGKRTGSACNRTLRWAAIEAVTGAVQASPRMRSLHTRVRNRNKTTPNKARVAVARELMELVHLLLTRGQMYREQPPARPGSRRAQPQVAGTARRPMNRASQITSCARSAETLRSQAAL